MNSNNQDLEVRTLDASGAEKFKNDLRLGVDSIGILTDDNLQFLFRVSAVGEVLSVDGVRATVVPPSDRVLKTGEMAQLVCLLTDGCYLARVRVQVVNLDEASFVFAKEIHRLERRNDCRTQVPAGFAMSFRMNSINRKIIKTKDSMANGSANKFPIIDVSARGFRMGWSEFKAEIHADAQSESRLPELKVGDHLSGELNLPAGRRTEIFAVVRNLGVVNGQSQVGVELQNATIRDEQLLLFACMQILKQKDP